MNDLSPEEQAMHEIFRELRERDPEVSERFLARLRKRLELIGKLRGGPSPERIASDLLGETANLAGDLIKNTSTLEPSVQPADEEDDS